MFNKMLLLNKTTRSRPLIYIIAFILFCSLTSLSYFVKTFDVLNVTGIFECDDVCGINLSFPYDKVNILQYNDLKLSYLDKDYEIEDVIYGDPYLNDGVPFQDIKIVTSISGEERIISFNLLYNKQRILEKMKDVVVNGE